MNSDKPVDRRRFFREGLRELLKPLAQAIEPLEQAARQLERLDSAGPAATGPGRRRDDRRLPLDVWLRPPGALAPDKGFRDACSRCGDCVRVCPAQCIKIESGPSGRGGGVPFIDPDEMPCVLCDGLLCMHNCPTTALVPTPLEMIDTGTAE